MIYVWNIFEIIINVYQGYIVSYFCYKFLNVGSNKNFIKSHGVTFTILFAFLITILNQYTGFEGLYSLIYIAVTFIYCLIALEGRITEKIFSSIYINFIIVICSILTANVFAVIFSENLEVIYTQISYQRITAIITTQLFITYTSFLSLKILNRKRELSHKEWLIISVIFFSGFLLGIIFILSYIDKQRIQAYILIGLFVIMAVNTSTLFFISDISKKNKKLVENEISVIEKKYNADYIHNVNEEYKMIKKLRHDNCSLYITLKELISSEQYNKAEEFLSEMIKTSEKKLIYLHTKNTVVNAIVNAKLSLAVSYGIHVSCMSIDEIHGIEDVDLCRLLSNMLDNALTAAKSSENNDRIIHLEIQKFNGQICFLLKNTIQASVINDNKHLKTTKQDSKNHGNGVYIIREIAEKYQGRADFYEQCDLFCCNVILNPDT